MVYCGITNMADDAKCVLVTVGTTSFDRLIDEVISTKVIDVLKDLGFRKLVLQYGRGETIPQDKKGKDFEIQGYRYKDSLHDDISNASVVISHAGAGTVMETLGAGRPLVVVINEQLMGNHQLELAEQLAEEGHLFYCTCSELSDVLRNMDISTLKPYVPGEPAKFASFLDKFMGVS